MFWVLLVISSISTALGAALFFNLAGAVEERRRVLRWAPWTRWMARSSVLPRLEGVILLGFGVAVAIVDVIRFR
jgi:hypothetical protein